MVHTSGASGPAALTSLAQVAVSFAVLHPLQTIATPEQGIACLPGSYFAIAGEGPARVWAEQLAADLEGRVLALDGGKQAL